MTEKGEIKRDGAKAQKNSGRGDYQKGDALLGDFTVDYKDASKSFTLNENVWGKICMDAVRNGHMVPVLKITLGTEHKTRLGIVGWDIIEDYIRLRKEEDENAL